MAKRISYEKALELIKTAVLPLEGRELRLENALGCVLAENVRAKMDQPPFPRSPYDGYALRAEDTAGACESSPVSLELVGKSYAGSPSGVTVGAGQAVRIMTGGVIPQGADCVIMQEKTDYGEKLVKVYSSLFPRDNYCPAGEDFRSGDLLVSAGEVVTASEYAVLTSGGCESVAVFPKPRVAVIATGDELQGLGTALSEGQIYNSNSAYICARLRELAVPTIDAGAVGDSLEELKGALVSALKRAELVITTGGVSVGEKDLMPSVLESLGAELVFHGVDMKPGMPATLAVFEGKPVLALSGNPFAAAVTFELLARPAIARLAHNGALLPEKTTLRLSKTFSKRNFCPRYQRGLARDGAVSMPEAQSNGRMSTMPGGNCLVELPVSDAPLEAGTLVTGYMI